MRKTFLAVAAMFLMSAMSGCVFAIPGLTGSGGASGANATLATSDNPGYTAGSPAEGEKFLKEGEAAGIPPRMTGTTRIYGSIVSVGPYYADKSESMASRRGAGWERPCEFGMGGDRRAWFFADISPDGKVVYARAYLSGYYAGSELVADLRAPYKGGYGKATAKGWEVAISGKADVEARGFTEEDDMVLVIRGKGDIMSLPAGSEVRGEYLANLVFGNGPVMNWKRKSENGDNGDVVAKVVK